MSLRHFELVSDLPVAAEEAYAWHARVGAFERLTPPWEPVRVIHRQGDRVNGAVTLEVPIGPVRYRWVARQREVTPGREFVDEQVEGPFRRWVHHHRFEPTGASSCRYADQIEYELPFGPAGALAEGWVRGRLRRAFRYRHATVLADLLSHRRAAGAGPLTILVSGATGLIGRSLIPFLSTGGHHIRRLVRRDPGPDDILWDPAAGRIAAEALDGVQAVVHLAGEPIGNARWTGAVRRRIEESRSVGTVLLAESLARLRTPPRVLVSASAVGVYGDRGDQILTEDSPIRSGSEVSFVERVGRAWEDASAPAEQAGIRVARMRIGVVLTPAGGALARMLPLFRAGLGGRLGSGSQFMSWIGIDDLLGALLHTIVTSDLAGPVNATAPEPISNADFTAALGAVLHRPTMFPVPAFALRLVLGEMADDLLLASARVVPARLRATGYRFRHPGLADALRHVLGR